MSNQEGAPSTDGTVEVSPKARKRTPLTPAEKKKRNTEAAKRYRDRKAKAAGSDVEIKAKDAKAILLDERKIQNEHVADTIIGLAQVAARQNNVPFNRYLFTHGLRAALAARDTDEEQPLPATEPEVIDGEIIHKTDLWALWDMGFWRQPEVTF